jgi:hypothetical protein
MVAICKYCGYHISDYGNDDVCFDCMSDISELYTRYHHEKEAEASVESMLKNGE